MINKEKKNEIEYLVSDINSLLLKLESTFWDVYVQPGEYDYHPDSNGQPWFDYQREDKKTWLYYGTRALYFKICLFFELKNTPIIYNMFTDKFGKTIENIKETMKDRAPLYEESEPTMVIHDEFRDFLQPFQEFKGDFFKRLETDKLKQILENTNSLLSKTKTTITNETSIYEPIKWFIEIVYPTMRSLGKARFIKKFTTYHPDILIPEISSAVEYKYIRKGKGIETFLDQIKTDADNYEGDSEYKFFYAIVYFEDKSEINPEAFKQSVFEKKFPDNWNLLAL